MRFIIALLFLGTDALVRRGIDDLVDNNAGSKLHQTTTRDVVLRRGVVLYIGSGHDVAPLANRANEKLDYIYLDPFYDVYSPSILHEKLTPLGFQCVSGNVKEEECADKDGLTWEVQCEPQQTAVYSRTIDKETQTVKVLKAWITSTYWHVWLKDVTEIYLYGMALPEGGMKAFAANLYNHKVNIKAYYVDESGGYKGAVGDTLVSELIAVFPDAEKKPIVNEKEERNGNTLRDSWRAALLFSHL